MEADSESPLAELGIVFVHGIGDHKESETLLAFGEPMTDWLAEWLRPRGGDVVITDARLRANRTEAESPAYALAEIRTGEGAHTTCLMTEAWWGESVRPPDSLHLLGWLFYRGPLLIFAHFCLGRKEETPFPLLLRSFYIIPLCAAVQFLALIAMILWIIPIDYVRTRVAGAVRILTLTLGDSFVLLEQEFQRAAFVARVRAALCWVAGRARHVVLIAHSQGGAIAHEAIAHQSFDKLRHFITVGSGLEKLYFLRAVRRDRKALLPAAIAAPLAIAWPLAWWGSRQDEWLAGFTYVSGLAFLAALVTLSLFLEDFHETLKQQLRDAKIDPPWLDLYATHDLVAAGPHSLLPETVKRQAVVNRRSLLGDHVTYFTSREDSVPTLWHTILGAARGTVPWPPNPALKILRDRHDWHTRALAASFWATLAAALASLYVFRIRLLDHGRLLESVADSLGLAKLNKAAAGLSAFGLPAAAGIWASLAVLLLYALGWRALHALWELCGAARWRRHCAITSNTLAWQLPPQAVPLFLMGLSTLPLLLVAGSYWQFWPALSPREIGSALFAVSLYGVAVSWVLLFNNAFWQQFLTGTRSTCLQTFFGALVPWPAALQGVAFFWRTGGFPAELLGNLQTAVIALFVVAWTARSLVANQAFGDVAALAPWLAAGAIFAIYGFPQAVLAALAVTISAQGAMILLHAKPKA